MYPHSQSLWYFFKLLSQLAAWQSRAIFKSFLTYWIYDFVYTFMSPRRLTLLRRSPDLSCVIEKKEKNLIVSDRIPADSNYHQLCFVFNAILMKTLCRAACVVSMRFKRRSSGFEKVWKGPWGSWEKVLKIWLCLKSLQGSLGRFYLFLRKLEDLENVPGLPQGLPWKAVSCLGRYYRGLCKGFQYRRGLEQVPGFE